LSQTTSNLNQAFAGESQANQMYLAFAEKAEKEGHPGVACLFRAVAEAERVHASKHFEAAGKVKSTLENLKQAIAGEHHEFSEMYPPFITQARAEGNQAAEASFERANTVEQVHYGLFQRAVAEINSGEGQKQSYYVCQVCGHTVAECAPERCPTCGAPEVRFKEID